MEPEQRIDPTPPEGFEPAPGSVVEAARSERKRRSDIGKLRGPRKVKAAGEQAQEEESIRSQLALSIQSLFSFAGYIAGWFGYDSDELTEDESKDGARYFYQLAIRFPWLVALSAWIAGPAWLFRMIGKKFRRKERVKEAKPNETPPPQPVPEPGAIRIDGNEQGE